MTKKIFLYIFILASAYSFAQKQTAFWYFGELAGIDFNSGSPIVVTDSNMTTNEGCATISSPNGDLLFYTNGQTVWNSNHTIMPNGLNLNGHFSSTNSAIIVPKPSDNSKYYIFTVDDLGGSNGLQYSEVDMALDGGLGDVTINKNIPLYTPTTEKITAVKHQNDTDWWILSHKWNSDEFVAYLVSSSGVGSPVTSSVGLNVTGDTENTVGAMKFSPNGNMVAIAHSYLYNRVELFNFNDVTGELTNPIILTGFNGAPGIYGVEFSFNSKLLYAADSEGSIYQYNVDLATSTDIINSRIEVANSITGLGALQIAPDGKIYAALNNTNHLGAITEPNILGLGCNYVNNAIDLNGSRSKLGLPPFIQSYFWKAVTVELACFGENTKFTLVNPEVSQTWNFDDPTSGVNNASTDVNPTHVFTNPGTYAVTVDVTNALGESSITTVNVIISETPIANTAQNYILCDDDLDDESNNGIIQSFLLSTIDSEILGTQDPNVYDVFYYEDINHTIAINKTLDYENIIANTQTVYAKIFNKNDDTCFDTTVFNLIVNEIPSFDLIEEKIICSNRLPDSVLIDNVQGSYLYNWRLDDGTLFSTDDTLIFNDVSTIPTNGLALTLTATDLTNNCIESKSILIRKITPITFTQDDIIISDLSSNNTITISPQDPNFNSDDYEYALGDENGNISLYQSELIFEQVVPGIKILYIRDIYNCDSFDIELSIIGFPHFFTPNNDGVNDTWHVLGVNRNFYTASIIRVFDRFGKIVANIKPSSDGWNGLYNNKELPETDYWFTAQLIDGDGNIREQKGHFSLIRR